MCGLKQRTNVMEVDRESFFYRGNVIDMQGSPMKLSNFELIVDLIDLYIELVEYLSA